MKRQIMIPKKQNLKVYPRFSTQFPMKVVTLSNGETIAYYDSYVNDSTKPVLFIIHGLMGGAYSFNKLLAVAPTYFRIIFPDIRGHGMSYIKAEAQSYEELADDFLLLAAELKIEKAYVYGQSFGTGIALKMAAMHPEFVQKLFLSSPISLTGIHTKNMEISNSGEQGSTMLKELKNLSNVITVNNTVSRIQKQDRKYFEEQLSQDPANAKIDRETFDLQLDLVLKTRGLRGAFNAMQNFNMTLLNNGVAQGLGDIKNVRCETLILKGSNDKYIKYHTIQEYINYLGGHITVKEFQNCGHSIHYQYPRELCETLLEFINKDFAKVNLVHLIGSQIQPSL